VYLYEHPEWPDFFWDETQIQPVLLCVRHAQGRLLGQMETLFGQEALQEEALLETLTEDILKSSEIEGYMLSHQQVRSSVARRLGLEAGGLPPTDWHIEGIVDMVLDATQNWQNPITETRLHGWHAALFPTGYSGMYRINAGQYRDDANGPMQVISGAFGREKIHFVAPAASRVKKFTLWHQQPADCQGKCNIF
jgi:Fic family protein